MVFCRSDLKFLLEILILVGVVGFFRVLLAVFRPIKCPFGKNLRVYSGQTQQFNGEGSVVKISHIY